MPWVRWDEHPVVLSNLVPQPGASTNAPCFAMDSVLFPKMDVTVAVSSPSFLMFAVGCFFLSLLFKGFGISTRRHHRRHMSKTAQKLRLRTSGWPYASMKGVDLLISEILKAEGLALQSWISFMKLDERPRISTKPY